MTDKNQKGKVNLLYLGLNDFFENFMWQTMIKYKEKKIEIEKEKKEKALKALEEKGDAEEEDNDSEEDDKDKKEIDFLKQFPNLSIFFKDNSSLIKKKGKVKGFKLSGGGWVAPTCCSMVINII